MNVFQKFKEYAMPRQAGRQAYKANALTKNPLTLIFCLFFVLAAFAFTGCTWGGEHTFDLTIEVPTNKMAMPQSKALLPDSDNTRVTIVAYLAGDYVHHTKEVFEKVPAGTISLPITLGGIPLGKSTVVIEAKAVVGPGTNDEKSFGYYGEQEIVVTGGVNTYTIDMDYGVIVECNSSGYSGMLVSESNGVVNINGQSGYNKIGERPLAEGDFLILQQGKKPSQQRNFTSRLRSLTAEDWLFKGYAVNNKWLYGDSQDITAPLNGTNNGEHFYPRGSQRWQLLSVWSNVFSSKFVTIPAGTFTVNSKDVTLTKSFLISNHEVTRKEWLEVFDTMPYAPFDTTVDSMKENFPVTGNWYRAIAYCNKRSLREGLTPCYSVNRINDWGALAASAIPNSDDTNWNNAACDWTANGYRLPTEVEWEIAARGPSDNVYAGVNDENQLGYYAWYGEDYTSEHHDVGKKLPNGYGLYDMSGNVWEWCWDWYDSDNYPTGFTDSYNDPKGAGNGNKRVLRGGSQISDKDDDLKCSDHNGNEPNNSTDRLGFRVVRTAQ